MVIVPAGGFSEDVDISISTVAPRSTPLQPNGSVRVGPSYEIEAVSAATTGQSISPVGPISLRLPYDPTRLPAEYGEDELVAVFWDGAGWVQVATVVDVDGNAVAATPAHLSMWTVEARNSRVVASLEIGEGNTLYAGDAIRLRLSARSLEGGGTPDAELFVTARYRDDSTGSSLLTEGQLVLTEAPEQAEHRLDLFPTSGTLGDRLLSVHERDQFAGDGFFDLVVDSKQVHDRVESIAFSARVGVGLSKTETDLAHMSFPLPLPPLADLAITGFELTDVDSQPVVVESLEEAQEVLLAVEYANVGGLPVLDARIELRNADRLLQEMDIQLAVGSTGVHNFRVRLRAGEQRLATLIRSVGQVADSNPADNQMDITVTAAAAVHLLSGRVVNDLGLGLGDAVLTLSGGGSIRVDADTDGRFAFPGLANGAYTLFPSHPDFQFPAVPVAINGEDLELATIVARPPRFALSGRVVDAGGTGVAELVVRLSGDAMAATMTDTAGRYLFENPPSGNYGVNPDQDGFTVTPAEAKLFLAGIFRDIDFLAVRVPREDDPGQGTGAEPDVDPVADAVADVADEEPPADNPADEPGADPAADPGADAGADAGADPGDDAVADPAPEAPPVEDGALPDPGVLFVDLPGGATMEMVYIEAGTYTMGSPDFEPGRSADEGPQHQVEITEGFYLGRFEIKESEWESVMERPSSSGAPNQSGGEGPAVFVSWNDVQDFIDRANQSSGDQRFRLPTEAEWEYAARAGTDTRYSFGDNPVNLVDFAWY